MYIKIWVAIKKNAIYEMLNLVLMTTLYMYTHMYVNILTLKPILLTFVL